MGHVWQGTDVYLERPVAVKNVATDLLALTDRRPTALARFEREVKAAARLDHANITAVYDAAVTEDVRCLVMQLADGTTHDNRHGRGDGRGGSSPGGADGGGDGCGVRPGGEPAFERGVPGRHLDPLIHDDVRRHTLVTVLEVLPVDLLGVRVHGVSGELGEPVARLDVVRAQTLDEVLC
ncbi:hypothetical protein ACIBQ5_04605 [Streptomyces massasporeus]|uniref:hypothetical protein n=1 Tax=Streptomyces massasporeus TaxID=67324 RepID=UPI00378B2E04